MREELLDSIQVSLGLKGHITLITANVGISVGSRQLQPQVLQGACVIDAHVNANASVFSLLDRNLACLLLGDQS